MIDTGEIGREEKKKEGGKKKSISLALRILPRWILYRLYFKPRAGIRLRWSAMENRTTRII